MNKIFKSLGLIFILIGLFMIVSTWVVYSIDYKIVRENYKAKAIVLEKYFLASADGDSDFMLKYYFVCEQNKRQDTDRGVPEDLYNKINDGDTIDVFYSKDDPQRNFPVGSRSTSIGLSIFVSILGVIFIGFGLVIFLRKTE